MKHYPSWLAAVLAIGMFTLTSGRAHAADTCPTAGFPGIMSVLKFYDFDPAKFNQHDLTVNIGRADFYGQKPLIACIEYVHNNQYFAKLHWIVDEYDHLLSWLPEPSNYMCFGNGSTDRGIYANVLYKNETLCGVTMYPLNYNGNQLIMYGGAGVDHIHGGAGVDVIYGGIGGDDIDEAGHGPIASWGACYGEDQSDFLYGSTANSSVLNGGVGNDQLYDSGGTGERLYGGSGNECCIYDHGHVFDILSCGSGSDGVVSLAGTTECNYTQSQALCGTAAWTCPP